MKYVWRLFVYIVIFWLSFSVGYVILLRFIPVTITPLKITKLAENFEDKGLRIYSDWCRFGNINIMAMRAVMASEDNNFLIHYGFDWEQINKAIAHNRRGRSLRGASTITQQTAKNIFCYPSRNWLRKGVETYYTVLIETLWSKKRIMECYLNVIEIHPNVYGVEAACKRFYDKPASKINIYDASMIATVLPNPRKMNIAAPSSYMAGRAARIRTLMNMLPTIDFDDPIDPSNPRKSK